MKKVLVALLMILGITFSCGENVTQAQGKILVAYFSRVGNEYSVGNVTKGNTAKVAEIIAEKTGADVFEIKPVQSYPVDYDECTKIAKTVFVEMWKSKDSAEKIVKDKGLVQITDTGAIEKVIDEVIAKNEKAVADYRGGNKKAVGALVGQVMKLTKGKANPQMVNQLLAKKLNA